jgi:hypothetical protein
MQQRGMEMMDGVCRSYTQRLIGKVTCFVMVWMRAWVMGPAALTLPEKGSTQVQGNGILGDDRSLQSMNHILLERALEHSHLRTTILYTESSNQGKTPKSY